MEKEKRGSKRRLEGNGDLDSAHLYMLQGNKGTRVKKVCAFTKHCFCAKEAPSTHQGLQRKAGGQEWLVCVCLRVSMHTGAGRAKGR